MKNDNQEALEKTLGEQKSEADGDRTKEEAGLQVCNSWHHRDEKVGIVSPCLPKSGKADVRGEFI